MIFERVWAMPNKWTFTIKPIRELLLEEMTDGIWLDPLCGKHSPVDWKYCNDLSIDMFCRYHMDALEWLRGIRSNFASGIIKDPPYSFTQATRRYGGKGYGNKRYWSLLRDEIGRIIKPGGKAICCGWNSGGLGLKRGFTLQRILLVPHGGGRNDTIVTVETKL